MSLPNWRASAAATTFLVSVTALVILSGQIAPAVTHYVTVIAIGSALVSILLWRGIEISGRTVMLVAVIGHGIALWGNTVYEDDYYRFIWDGWRVLEAGTPYGVPPENYVDDPAVPLAMRNILEWVNYPYFPTIYGPVLQVLFAFTYLMAGSDELGLRILFAGAALLLSALFVAQAPAWPCSALCVEPFGRC